MRKTINGATLIGHPDYLKEHWWLMVLYPQLSDEDIELIENRVSVKLPDSYVFFLKNISNGLTFQFGDFYLYGYITEYHRDVEYRQPFDILVPNIDERENIHNLKQDCFIIGGYSYDGSQLYIDTNNGKIYLCSNTDSTPLFSWDSFDEMLQSELTRLYDLYSEDGLCIDEDKSTLPMN